MTNNLLI